MDEETEAQAGNVAASMSSPASGTIWCVLLSALVSLHTSFGASPSPYPGTHLKEALSLAQAAPLHVPEVDVGFPAGDEHSRVCGVEGGHQHGLVGALWGAGRC